MTQIKFGDKTIIIEDGANVEISGDEIRVSPGTPAPQPVYVPLAVPYGPFAPIYPGPFYPTSPFVTQPFPGSSITLTGDNPVRGLTVGGGVAPLEICCHRASEVQ